MKKISSFILAFTMMISMAFVMNLAPITAHATESSVWDGTTTTQPTSMKTIDGVYYYEISTAEELAYIAKTGGDWLGYNYILANDITLNSVELTYDANGNLTVNASTINQWTPINGFKGIFNGNNHTISGVYVNATSSAGFFTNFQGDLKNLTITNSYIKGTSGVGGISSGSSKVGADVDKCYFYGAVVGTSNVGGLFGSVRVINISNCANYGNVFATGNNVGGICGSYGSYGIDNCINEGNIYSTGNYVGGITGGSVDIYDISGCINKGNVTGNKYVGGICSYGSDISIWSCGNTGNITGTEYVGGLLGYNANDTYDSSIGNGYNTGLINGTTYVGGIVGYATCCNLSSNYNVANVIGTSNVGAIAGHSDTVWGKGTASNNYYFKSETINTNLQGFGNVGDVEGIVRSKKAGFFPILSNSTADPSFSGLGYKNGETDDPIQNDSSINTPPDTETVWDGTTLKPSVLVVVDNISYYKIYTGKELAYIAQTGGEWLGYNYILANDITLNDANLTYDANGNLTVSTSSLNKWTPINGFTGIFNGNGHTISGVYVNESSSAGFFTNFQGDLKNLTITNSYIKGTSGVGGISSGSSKVGADVDKCYFYGAVVGTSNVGGLFGSVRVINISNCANYGDVFATGNNVGGICGSYGSYGIDNCVNEGNIYSTGNYVGGITGGSVDIYDISGCINKGNVTGNKYVGGICSYGSDISIWNCGNIGNITGTEYVGGLLGYNANDTYESSINSGYNTGAITGTTYVGGIVGYATCCDLSNNYNAGNVIATTNAGGIAGYSDTIWGKGTASNCVYMKTETINATLKGFGNADDVDGVVNAKDDSFFCVNSDKTLNKNGHTYSSTVPCDATCDNCGYERTVTHTYDNVKYDSDKHWYECDCGEAKPDSVETHIGGAATCTNKAKCDVCKQAYGDLNVNNHTAATSWTNANDQHYHTCSNGCDAKLDLANCADTDKNHECDVCSNAMGTHEAASGKHTCDYCNQTVTECADSDKDHKCDVCSAAMGTHEAASGKHTCDYCGQIVTECADTDKNHKCDVCSADMGTHEAATDKHTCDYCGKTVSECTDSTEDDDSKCDICYKDLGTVHTHTFVEGKCACGETDPNHKPETDDPEEPNDRLGTGAITGIVVGSVAVVGGGGFALFWFVLKKKTWLDLLMLFKK